MTKKSKDYLVKEKSGTCGKTMAAHILNKYSKEKAMLEAVGLNSHRKLLYSILRYATGKNGSCDEIEFEYTVQKNK